MKIISEEILTSWVPQRINSIRYQEKEDNSSLKYYELRKKGRGHLNASRNVNFLFSVCGSYLTVNH